jgi:DNA-binding response OmpR family regulator
MDYSSARVSHPAGWPAGLDGVGVQPAAAAPTATATPPVAARGDHERTSTPAQLLLFVGDAIRPDAALASLLAHEGLRCLHLHGAEQALRAAALARFDVVLVDSALVDGRAIEALASTHRCPVVVLAETADEVDEIVALELGADLYLSRPLAPRRLRAHLRALFRRRAEGVDALEARSDAGKQPARTLRAGGWTLDTTQLRLTQGARSVRLTQAHAALLQRLMAAAGDIVPADELLAVLPQHERLQPCGLRVHVHRLRQRLRDEAVFELRIEAVRGTGYALVVP